jgi:hypothetical protein
MEELLHSLIVLSASDGGEWSASYPSHFIPWDRVPSLHLIGWVDPDASFTAIWSQWIMYKYCCTCTGPVCQVAEIRLQLLAI